MEKEADYINFLFKLVLILLSSKRQKATPALVVDLPYREPQKMLLIILSSIDMILPTSH